MELRARSVSPDILEEEFSLEEERFIMLPRQTVVWFQIYLGDISDSLRSPGFDTPVMTILKKITRVEATLLLEHSGTYKLSSIEREEAIESRDKRLAAYLNKDLVNNFIRRQGIQLGNINQNRIMEGNLIVGFPLPEGTIIG